MDKFIQKLKDDTENGLLDGVWKYSDGSESYSFVIPKHYLNGMRFSLIGDEAGLMIFPNGFGINFGKSDMTELKNVVDISLERTVDTSISSYLGEVAGLEVGDKTESNSEESPSTKPAPSSSEEDNSE